MFRPLSFFIGLRYTRAKRRNHFISFISLISMLGLSLGVLVLILVLSVMNGFDRELKQRVLGMVPHASISVAEGTITDWPALVEKVSAYPGVIGAAPFVEAQGMLTNRGLVRPVAVYGIEPEYEAKVSIVDQHMKMGELQALKPGEFGIVLGDLLARALGVGVGGKVTLLLPEATVSPAGVFPRMKRFTVVGTFSVGADLDGNLAFMHLQDGARFMRIQGAEGVRLQMTDLFEAPRLSYEVANSLPGRYFVSDWTRSHGRLFQAIQMEKTMVGLLLTLIIAVAAFNIVATLVMVVTDKQSDIAILRTLGASSGDIMATFMVQGLVIGVTGTLSGALLGILAALNVAELVAWLERALGIHFLNPDVYFISYLPSELLWSDVAQVCAAGLLMSFIATLYPAWRASKTQPAEALRYE